MSHTLASSSNIWPRLFCTLQNESGTHMKNLALGRGRAVLERPHDLGDLVQLYCMDRMHIYVTRATEGDVDRGLTPEISRHFDRCLCRTYLGHIF
jgi:hypothetical protein